MARQNTGKKVSSANNAILPRLPTNPSRVDRLIVDSLKEHSKVSLYLCINKKYFSLSFCSSLSVCLHIPLPFNLLKYVNNESQVVTLLTKMEELNEKVFHPNIHSAMDGWLDSTRKVQARRKEEIINATNRHRSGAPRNHDERGKHCAVCVVTAYLKACA